MVAEHEPDGVGPAIRAGHLDLLTDVILTYLVDGYYNVADELGVAWDDPEVAADWGVADPILSGRDQGNPQRAYLPDRIRPAWPMRT